MDRPTFSQSWSRVSRLTPMLRPQVHIHRQLFRGEPWHVVHDPVSNNFFRLNPVAWHFVGLLDGRISVDDAWRMTLERHGDSAPTQNEVIGLLGQLNEANLLRVDLPADAAPLLKRQRKRVMRQWGSQLMSILSLRFPIFNPDKMLSWLLPFFRPFLTKWGGLAWIAWILFCLSEFLPHLQKFIGDSDADSLLKPTNWGWMMLCFILVKAWHELGHGIICKRFGGTVPEVGIMLLVLFPAPYVDATSSWNFPDKWKRMLVGAAGMIFELGLAGVAALVWLNSEPESLTRQLAHNVVFLASVTTLLFNGNPLLRFDGYYILSDLLEIPNLYDRSGRQLRYLWQKYMFGMTNAQVISVLPGEQWFLAIYGVLSQVYRVLIMISIALFISEQIPVLGAVIAAWSIIAWALFPTGKFLRWLATSPQLYEHRARAVTVTAAVALVLIGCFGFWDWPVRPRGEGIVESLNRSEVLVESDGFIKRAVAESGQTVKKGDVLLEAENPELIAEQKRLMAEVQKFEVLSRQTLTPDKAPVENAIAREQLAAMQKQLAEISQRIAELTVRAPQDGRLTMRGGSMKQWEGRFLRRGEKIASVEDLDALEVRVLMDQQNNASGFAEGIKLIEMRTSGRIANNIKTEITRVVQGGTTELPHPAFAAQGGGQIALDPNDREQTHALRPQFHVWLELPKVEGNDGKPQPAALPGERVYVRFTLANKRPLLIQWVHRARQVVRDRLGV